MKASLLSLAILSCSLISLAAPGAEGGMSDADKTKVKMPSELFRNLPDPEKALLLSSSIYSLHVVDDPERISSLFEVYGGGVAAPSFVKSSHLDASDYNASAALTYLFRSYAKNHKTYTVPVVISTDKGRYSRGYVSVYNHSVSCAGMGHFEASLKDLCHIANWDEYGLLELNYNQDIGLFGSNHRINQIPNNGKLESYSTKIFKGFPTLLGMFSNHSDKAFSRDLSSFDKNLYASRLGSFVMPSMRFSQMGPKCTSTSRYSCSLYFLGPHVRKLFAKSSQSPYDRLLNLGVYFDKNGRSFLNLRNSILSDSTFINYGFYNQAELNVLKDLGYDISDREFFGHSIYSSGYPQARALHQVHGGYTSWSDTTESYNIDKASLIPLSVGTHVYGNFNEVIQHGLIASQGFSAVGMRIDGTGNYITVPKETSIIEKGERGSCIAVTYGSDNVITVKGDLEATGIGGVALRFDFGSNALSDLSEYRGSYRVVRSYDYFTHKLKKHEAQAVFAPYVIRGPSVAQLNIAGTVNGRMNSIYIDDTSFVRQINIERNARLTGNIVSDWNFYEDSHGALYSRPKNSSLLHGRLQFDNTVDTHNPEVMNRVKESLYTTINLGVIPQKNRRGDMSYEVKADHKSKIHIKGSIVGDFINLKSHGGHTEVEGCLDINRFEVADSSVVLSGENGDLDSKVNTLKLEDGASVMMNDGIPQRLLIDSGADISEHSAFCVDTDEDGYVIDNIVFKGKVTVPSGKINFEPGITYSDVKRFASDPRLFYRFLNRFVSSSDTNLGMYGVKVNFPKHVWYRHSQMGRYVNCSAKGCYLGDYLGAYTDVNAQVPLWRYILSFAGCVVLIFVSVILLRKSSGSQRFG